MNFYGVMILIQQLDPSVIEVVVKFQMLPIAHIQAERLDVAVLFFWQADGITIREIEVGIGVVFIFLDVISIDFCAVETGDEGRPS